MNQTQNRGVSLSGGPKSSPRLNLLFMNKYLFLYLKIMIILKNNNNLGLEKMDLDLVNVIYL